MAKFVYSDHYEVNLPENYRFPMAKYRMLKEELLRNNIITQDQLEASFPVSKEQLYSAHDKNYVDAIFDLSLDWKKARKIGLPLQNDMVTRTRASVGGSIQAFEHAKTFGYSAALSSGTHHALYDSGEGFCFFNDFAVIVKLNPHMDFLIIDLDVHQGNGNAAILKDDPNVKIIDLYCKENYPFRKVQAHIDVPLPKFSTDEVYLSALKTALTLVEKESFDFILYQGGVDLLIDDHLGQLNISYEGVRKRDQMVFEFAKSRSFPLSSVIGGGYCKDISKTVKAYTQTFIEAKNVFHF